MRFIQTLMFNRRKAGIFALLSVACLLLILSGCQNPVQQQEYVTDTASTQQRDMTGTVSLTFNQGLGRAIMPPTGVAQFDKFEIVFSQDNMEVRRVWTYEQLALATVELAAGDWSLVVTAFQASGSTVPTGNGGDLGGFRKVAVSEAISVAVTEGENTNVHVVLGPITGDGYKGTFLWNINFAAGSLITSAEMVIWEYEDRTDAVEIVDLLDADADNYLILPTGEYWVVITLGSENPAVGGGLGKALRVYYNMYSVMEDLKFGDADLSVSPLGLILLAWDGNEWDFSGLEEWGFDGLTAPNFAIVGVAGVDDGNIDYLEDAFNDIVSWNEPFSPPDDLAQLMQFVDAALIIIGASEDFRNDVLLYQSAAVATIEAMIENESTIEHEWVSDHHTLTVNIGDENDFVLVVEIDFGRAIPVLPPLTGTVNITGTLQEGQTLTANTAGLGGSGAISHEWMRGTEVVGTGSTYIVQADDVGSNFTLRVTRADNSGYVASMPMLTGTVTITGTVQRGQTLTANTGNLGGTGTLAFQWRRGTTNIVGATNATYTLQAADVDGTISVVVTRDGNSGSVISAPTATVTNPPLTGSVSISGTVQVNQILTANTANLGGTGTISFQWQRRQGAAEWANIAGATSSTFTVRAADVEFNIRVTVARVGYSGTVSSSQTVAVPPALTGSISISGPAVVGETLTVTYNLSGTGTIRYQWQRRQGAAEWVNIAGATSSTFTVRAADEGFNIRVSATRDGNSGSVSSGQTAAVIQPPTVHWINATPPIVGASYRVLIGVGAAGTLIVPEGATVRIDSVGTDWVDNAGRALTLNIGAGARVVWRAYYESTFNTATAVTIIGTGTFEVAAGGIWNGTSGGTAINTSSASTIIVSGGLVNAWPGWGTRTISSSSTSGTVIVSGGIVRASGTNTNRQAINVAGTFNVTGGLVIAESPNVVGATGIAVVNRIPDTLTNGTLIGYTLGGSHATGTATGLVFLPSTGATVSWGLRDSWETGINHRGNFFSRSGVSVGNRIVWNSDRIPAAASIDTGSTITIAEGASGTLTVPDNVSTTIVSQGAATVDNGNRQISLNIGANARVTWRANYDIAQTSLSGVSGASIIVSGTGTLDVAAGSIVASSNQNRTAIGSSSNSTIMVSGGSVNLASSAGGVAILSTGPSGIVRVEGGQVMATASAWAIESTGTSGTVEVTGGVVSAVTGRAVSSSGASATVEVSGGRISTTTSYAIHANVNGTFRLTGGLVVAQRGLAIGTNGVVNRPATNVLANGIIVGYTAGTHSSGSTTGLVFQPTSAAVSWGISGGQSAITHPGGVFTPVPGVTVTAPAITWTATASGSPTTTAINFNFGATPTGLLATDITITSGTGSATRGTLSGTGTTRTLTVSGVSAGTVSVSINRAGIVSGPQTVTLVGGAAVPGGVTLTASSPSATVNVTAGVNGRVPVTITAPAHGSVVLVAAGGTSSETDPAIFNGQGSAAVRLANPLTSSPWTATLTIPAGQTMTVFVGTNGNVARSGLALTATFP